jgi:hypothetical protein
MVDRVTKKINLKNVLRKMNSDQKAETLEEVGEFIVTSILDNVGSAKSPVHKGKYKKSLSPDYKKLKSAISGNSTANMELYGDMLDALEFKITDQEGILEVGYFEESGQVAKADNHNKFSAKSKKTKLPYRQHIPRPNERFKDDIMSEVVRIIRDASKDTEEA